MIEPEMAFADLCDNMDNAESMIKFVISAVMEKCPDELAFCNAFVDKGLIKRLELVRNSSFARVSYTESVDILQKSGKEFAYPVYWGCDLQTEHERYLTEEHFKSPFSFMIILKKLRLFI